MTSARTCAIVLAAGRSRRMGPGVQKLLLPLAGTTVVGRVIDALLASAVDKVIVVTGPDARVADAVAGHPVAVVTNGDPDADMLSSVRCGLRALPPECDAVLVAPGDQPGVTPGLLDQMLATYRICGRGILVPAFDGRRGHPLLFSARCSDEILRRYDGEGLRGLLRAHRTEVFEMQVEAPAVLDDIDLPADYRREVERSGVRSDRDPTR